MKVYSSIYNDEITSDAEINNLSSSLKYNIDNSKKKDSDLNLIDKHIKDICLCKNFLYQSILDYAGIHIINDSDEIINDNLYSYEFDLGENNTNQNVNLLDYILTFNTPFDFGLDYDGYDVNKAIERMNEALMLTKNGVTYTVFPAQNKKSYGWCARCVRTFLEAGGINTDGRPGSAYQYWKNGFLEKKGFKLLAVIFGKANQNNWTTANALPGDIAVMEHNVHGHICMYDGNNWVSDFRQNNAWPYSGDGKVAFFRYGKSKLSNKPEIK